MWPFDVHQGTYSSISYPGKLDALDRLRCKLSPFKGVEGRNRAFLSNGQGGGRTVLFRPFSASASPTPIPGLPSVHFCTQALARSFPRSSPNSIWERVRTTEAARPTETADREDPTSSCMWALPGNYQKQSMHGVPY